MCGFIDFVPHTFLQNQKTVIVLFSILYKNVFDASDLLFTGGKYHVLLYFFKEKGMLSQMVYFELLKKGNTWHLPPVNIKIWDIEYFFLLKIIAF